MGWGGEHELFFERERQIEDLTKVYVLDFQEMPRLLGLCFCNIEIQQLRIFP